jgi:hypothetical protein
MCGKWRETASIPDSVSTKKLRSANCCGMELASRSSAQFLEVGYGSCPTVEVVSDVESTSQMSIPRALATLEVRSNLLVCLFAKQLSERWPRYFRMTKVCAKRHLAMILCSRVESKHRRPTLRCCLTERKYLFLKDCRGNLDFNPPRLIRMSTLSIMNRRFDCAT